MFTVQQPNLDTILENINRFINIDRDREVYANHFESIKILIFKKLREKEPFKNLFKGYQMGGSYGDNLKVSVPNEFDLVFHVQFPENRLIEVVEDDDLPGNVHLDLTEVLRKIRNEKQHNINIRYMRQWVNDDNYLIIDKLQSYFQSCFTKVLTDMAWSADVRNEYVGLRYTREGPAHTIKVNGRNIKYSVDFVPGILLNETQSVLRSHVGQWEAIPKPIYNSTPNYTSFRSSFYRQEQNLIKDNKNLKNVLRMMKKFRDAHQNMSNMKSYFIKTLFLWKAKEKQSTINYWHSSLKIIITDMFQAMQSSLELENLPFFWDSRLNMYEKFSDKQFREMLGCVINVGKILKSASQEVTLPLQKRVYAIFLESRERCPNVKSDGINEEPEYIDEEPEDTTIPKKKEDSWCSIL